MKKIFVLLGFILVLTGCTVSYNVEISSDLKVTEKVFLEASQELYDAHYRTTKNKVLEELLAMYKDELDNNDYKTEIIKGEKPYVQLEKEYQDIEGYLNGSKLFNDYFDKINYHKDGNIITIETEGFNPNEEENPDRFYLNKLDIVIKCAYNVIDSNATNYDKKNNEYHFIINENDQDFKILFKFDASSPFVSNLDLYVLAILLVFLTIGAWVFVVKKKKENR